MRMRIPPGVLVGLGCLVAVDTGVGFVLIRDVISDHSADTDGPAWEQQLPMIGESVSSQVVARRYRETLARPVFFKDRARYSPKPPQRQSAPSKSVPVPRPVVDPGITIAGVILSDGARKAYLLNKRGRHGTWVGQGDSISGWKVHLIDRAGVILKQNDRTIEVLLYGRE